MVQVYCSTNGEKEKRLVKLNGKCIGELKDGVFYKTVVGHRHQLRHPPAWAIQADVFDKLIKPNATKIVIKDKESGIEYHCSVESFCRLRGELDRGFGRQYFLTLNHWERHGNGHRQLSLWGGSGSA